MVREHTGRQIVGLGYAVMAAENGAEALAMIDNGCVPDLLFTDVVMPGGINGRQLALRLRERWPRLRVLYTSGYAHGALTIDGEAVARAATLGAPAIAVTFEPHPRKILRPSDPIFRLTDESAKLRLLAATGLNGALVLTFDAAFAALTAEQFVTRILVGRLGIRGATIGFDFHFGHQRGGSPAFLAEQGERYGFTVETAAPLEDEGRPVSSSSIRAALAEGRAVEAAELLGYPWFAAATAAQ